MLRNITITIIFNIFVCNMAFSCDSLWVDNISFNDDIYTIIDNLAKKESLSIAITPKALLFSSKYQEPSLIISKMDFIKIESWKILISEECDKKIINELELHNKNSLKKFKIGNNKVFDLYYAGTDVRIVLETFSDFCKIPIDISKMQETKTRVWAYSGSPISCADFLGLLSANGVKISLIERKLIAEKA